MSEPEDRRRPPTDDDTFDTLFPSDRGSRGRESHPDSDETYAMTQDIAPVPRSQHPSVGSIGSPPPPRSAATVLPWLIIGASLLSLAVVGLVILRGQSSTTSAAPSPSLVTQTATASSPAALPPPATDPPPGFQKCAGSDTGFKVAGTGTTCPFVSKVATQATVGAASSPDGNFSIRVSSDTTGMTYTLSCSVQAYIQCTIPATGNKSVPTYIYVMRG